MKPITDEERPRFLTDEGFNMEITTGLRRIYPTMDVLTVQEAGPLQAPDLQILEEMRQIDRILLSHDVHTMPGYFYAILAQLPSGEHLPGVL